MNIGHTGDQRERQERSRGEGTTDPRYHVWWLQGRTGLQKQQSATCLGMQPESINGLEAFSRCENAPPGRLRFAFHSPATNNRPNNTESKGNLIEAVFGILVPTQRSYKMSEAKIYDPSTTYELPRDKTAA
ncbi:hypothetical protein FOXB_12464 [Fusarium oxysporum f. sp. conglutinans Fo5176]|uniref:Uncharacterized protein n=1 Tax=Fusarium oxysporum (strain Fo5176) TaxID=660025 RepID=F9G1D2_FUSOF|nr:hypothetical protein FOXB_12464 [Fusarium oxysporum f. sp. conglutinans Fo5176]